jgi:hypothetical protein
LKNNKETYRFVIPVFLMILLIFLMGYGTLSGQENPQNAGNSTGLIQFLEKAERDLDIKFYYRTEWIDSILIKSPDKFHNIEEVKNSLRNYGLELIPYSDWQYILAWQEKSQVFNEYTEDGNFRRDVIVSGFVRSLNTEEPLIGSTIYIHQLDTGTATDLEGHYSIVIPTGVYSLEANSVGLEPQIQQLSLTRDTLLNFTLADKVITLTEVVVSEEAMDQNVSDVSLGKTKLDILTIQGIPAFMGEVDVVRTLLLLPGVTTVGEGASGFNVRGGSVDQNLILIDETPIYNISHLFGIFSGFNQDLIQDVTLLKGGIPAQYGGRLSSVLDVKTREHVQDKFSGKGGIGLIASRLTLDIPVIKDKLSVTLGGRISYSDYLMRLLPDSELKNSSAWFYDANAKLNYNINKKNTMHISYYSSKDEFVLPSDTAYNWGTNNLSVRWNHLFGESLVGSLTGAISKYQYGVGNAEENYAFDWDAGIDNKSLKADFSWGTGENNKLNFGGSFIRYSFLHGDLIPGDQSSVLPVSISDDYANEFAVYAGDEWAISDKYTIMGGIRYSYFQKTGPSEVNIYEEGEPLSEESFIDVETYESGEVINSYGGLEPRLSFRMGLPLNSSLKFSYNRMYQYIHLLSNTMAVTPIDIWKPSGLYIRPQFSNQYSIGYFKNFLENSIETSVELFYKDITDLLEYKDGARLVLNKYIEEELIHGDGRAYGIEFFVRKKLGKLTGWVAYTYSRSERKVIGMDEEETINNGNYYPTYYDRPHDLTLTGHYQITRRWSFSANYIFMSGRPATYPENKYIIDRFTVAGYGDRNQYRIPDYHRLDISFTLAGNLKKSKKWDGSWTFSVYNLFARKNAYSVYFKAENGAVPQAYKLSVIGTAFPSITYNFKF